ncbi:YuzD family protein [Salimicrobium halophilum]|uniref:Disulfide oxidoreductase YuzD n=1 Tax=Salimicrobium halophilum TaxID=86666 RepID=A0A1G8VCX9_9BACI|nr:YuzD family protein [Salimicrobium halophilum]SDJ62990.1 Disulfide oxidoreductase YuzD [Salimicrobium halophilum]
MTDDKVKVTIYGAEERCASCVNAPGSKETYEWLQAAIGRKYGNESISYNYIDIFDAEEKDEFIEKIMEDELFYPLVLVEGEVAGEGTPRLKSVYQYLEKHGVKEQEG